MKTVTVDELREKLPQLLRLVARGKRVVITDGGKWVGQLAPPPTPPPTPEEEAEHQARVREIVDRRLKLLRGEETLAADSPAPAEQAE